MNENIFDAEHRKYSFSFGEYDIGEISFPHRKKTAIISQISLLRFKFYRPIISFEHIFNFESRGKNACLKQNGQLRKKMKLEKYFSRKKYFEIFSGPDIFFEAVPTFSNLQNNKDFQKEGFSLLSEEKNDILF